MSGPMRCGVVCGNRVEHRCHDSGVRAITRRRGVFRDSYGIPQLLLCKRRGYVHSSAADVVELADAYIGHCLSRMVVVESTVSSISASFTPSRTGPKGTPNS